MAAAGLAALAAVQLWPAAGPARLPQNLDLMLQYVPNAAYLARSLAAGRLPLWNPYQGAGMPFAADPGTGAWYLPNWPLLLALPLYAAVRAVLWAHLLWAALGCYAYQRVVLRVGPAPAWIGAAAFALSTWLPGLAGMPVVLTTVAWLPWVLLLGQRAASHPGRGGAWPAALAAAGALQAVAGWPAGAYLTWLSLGLLLLRQPGDHRKQGSRGWERTRRSGAAALLRVALGAGAAALLAGVLLVPAAEFVAETNYGDTRPLGRVAREGYLVLLSWLRPAGGSGSLESSQLYLGMAPLLLAFAGIAFGPPPRAATGRATGGRREAATYGGLALFALLVSTGTHGPLFAPLYQWLPGFRIVYLPARLGVVAAFALACLAALGAERIARGPWSARRAAVVAALAAAALPVVLGQFWHSEGYDDFRRLLTNLGRFTGGPFLTREQEVHYAAAALLALGALVLATRVPRRWAVGALVALTAADLALAQWRAQAPGGAAAFDPERWYRPALAGAGRLAQDLGGERLAGLQWHGTQHFLDDFPSSASPALLPPNLSLLAGVRDAQAYNPLLLRRAATYFAAINGGETDDHWLWIKGFHSPLVDRLGVRRVLAAGSEWRVTGRSVLEPLELAPGEMHLVRLTGAPVEASRLRIVSYLGQSTAIAQGTEVVEVRLLPESGAEQRVVLRAGLETAEWAYGRPDVRASVRHRQAPVALETRLVSAVAGTFSVYEYLATFELPEPIAIRAVRASAPPGWAAQAPGATAYIQGLWLEPPDDGSARPAAAGVDRPTAQPRLTIEGGGAVLLDDQPERVTARVSAAGAGTLVLADAYYPGWQAAVDGAAEAIVPVDGLFRGVRVPPGEHDVAFTYRPGSLRAGLALSAAGLLATAALALAGRGRRFVLQSERAGRSRRRPGRAVRQYPPPAR